MKKYTSLQIKEKFGYSYTTAIIDMKESVHKKIKRVGRNAWIILTDKEKGKSDERSKNWKSEFYKSFSAG